MKTHGMDRERVVREVMLGASPRASSRPSSRWRHGRVFVLAAADQITGTTISVDGGWTAL